MAKQVFINLPVENLERATAFYEALGFTKNDIFSDENASSLVWSDEIYFMLLNKDFYKTFIRDKSVIDTTTTSGTLIALSVDSKEEVQRLAEVAKANGGDYFKAGPQMPEEMMFGYEILDSENNQIEFIWMNQNFDPQSTT